MGFTTSTRFSNPSRFSMPCENMGIVSRTANRSGKRALSYVEGAQPIRLLAPVEALIEQI
jgi:hypothetical protein